jgi:hypothetical protein
LEPIDSFVELANDDLGDSGVVSE